MRGQYLDEYPGPGCDDEKTAAMMRDVVLFGDRSGSGFMTNPAMPDRPWIEINGEKVVCTAKGGECRLHPMFYTGSLNSPESWKTPVIQPECPNRCPYKYLVCDNHTHAFDEDVHSLLYYPEYNKFRGLFRWYCKDFKRLETKYPTTEK